VPSPSLNFSSKNTSAAAKLERQSAKAQTTNLARMFAATCDLCSSLVPLGRQNDLGGRLMSQINVSTDVASVCGSQSHMSKRRV
jgi:hypothetical protein